MAFHANLPGARGGFLGVDIFFVLSGFLITTLLVREHEHHGTIRLGRFYMRRTLRLLPALLALVVALHVWSTGFVFPEQVRQLRRETVATLFYVANWAQIAGYINPLGYFGHAWSLAIEEQFYIVWPLALRAMLGRFSRKTILAILAAAATASALLRTALARDPESFSRAFHGSDTRAEALLIGCFLAICLLSPKVAAAARRSAIPRILGVFATATLALLFTQTSWPSDFVFHGGFTLAALATALVLLDLETSPRGILARVLSWKPLVAIGQISYGLYLWHQPIVMAVAPWSVQASMAEINVLRFVATFAFATLSWFLVERPLLGLKRKWS